MTVIYTNRRNKPIRIDRSNIFSVVTAREARRYVGKEGFFANSIYILIARIKTKEPTKLEHVNLSDTAPVSKLFKPVRCRKRFGLFIPLEKVESL